MNLRILLSRLCTPVLAGVIVFVALTGCNKSGDGSTTAPAGPAAIGVVPSPVLSELRVAIDPTYEPFNFKTPDGQPTGFDIEIANALCSEIKRKCVFVEQV